MPRKKKSRRNQRRRNVWKACEGKRRTPLSDTEWPALNAKKSIKCHASSDYAKPLCSLGSFSFISPTRKATRKRSVGRRRPRSRLVEPWERDVMLRAAMNAWDTEDVFKMDMAGQNRRRVRRKPRRKTKRFRLKGS